VLDKEIVLVGYSGHGMMVGEAALLQDLNLKYYIDKNKVRFNPYELNYMGFERDEFFESWDKDFSIILGIGDNFIRDSAAKFFNAKGIEVLNISHPSAIISNYAKLGRGNFIAANVSVNPFVTIGDYCILNTGAIVEHECKIGNSVHVAPGAVLAGNVEIGDYSFVGANSVIHQGVKLGKNVVIGAGSVILKDIENNKKIVGNPGREL